MNKLELNITAFLILGLGYFLLYREYAILSIAAFFAAMVIFLRLILKK